MRHFVWILIIFSFITCLKSTDVQAKTKEKAASISRMAISPKDRTCAKDSDCDVVPTKCSCSCGEGVNKASTPKYTQLMKAMCEANPPEKVCKVKCDGQVKCMGHQCTYVAK